MKTTIKTLLTTLGLASTLLLTGCGEKEQAASDANSITVGVMAGEEAQVAEHAVKKAKKLGLDVELITFTDYVSPNAALDDGSVDVNAFQHKPYLDAQIKDRGYEFAIAGNTFVYPIAAYSYKLDSVADLPEDGQIAVPNNPASLGRSLLLLEQQGILKLKEGAGISATKLDIVENPKNIEIIELEGPQLPRSLEDVDIAIINNTFAAGIGLTPSKDGLFVEGKDSPYVNLIVARKDNVDAENVKTFVKAYQTDAVYNAAMEIFDGAVVKGW
ncbi:methionine ABC transporter substrate-binding protein MetQ [Salinivibrio sp. MA351]|uniref:methionine ABC transporter substrate-binding lipoprotein MetQ n=1 Tax=Salinivibrio sp. MA351 TaxID=1909453 RepID=UPI0009899AF1|nr:methionine ABC transporter substrate-binding lipoprotein MetQ [Salinivibrio sp. MA351]OOE96548.1 methionine ABC transporter substrate-binding protein MetQ [Salinivibrio sp. MA351]